MILFHGKFGFSRQAGWGHDVPLRDEKGLRGGIGSRCPYSRSPRTRGSLRDLGVRYRNRIHKGLRSVWTEEVLTEDYTRVSET